MSTQKYEIEIDPYTKAGVIQGVGMDGRKFVWVLDNVVFKVDREYVDALGSIDVKDGRRWIHREYGKRITLSFSGDNAEGATMEQIKRAQAA